MRRRHRHRRSWTRTAGPRSCGACGPTPLGHRRTASARRGGCVALGSGRRPLQRRFASTARHHHHARRDDRPRRAAAGGPGRRRPCCGAVHLGGDRASEGRAVHARADRATTGRIEGAVRDRSQRPPGGSVRPVRAVRPGARHHLHDPRRRRHHARRVDLRRARRRGCLDRSDGRVRVARCAGERRANGAGWGRPTAVAVAAGAVGWRAGADCHAAGHAAAVRGRGAAHAVRDDGVPAGVRHRPRADGHRSVDHGRRVRRAGGPWGRRARCSPRVRSRAAGRVARCGRDRRDPGSGAVGLGRLRPAVAHRARRPAGGSCWARVAPHRRCRSPRCRRAPVGGGTQRARDRCGPCADHAGSGGSRHRAPGWSRASRGGGSRSVGLPAARRGRRGFGGRARRGGSGHSGARRDRPPRGGGADGATPPGGHPPQHQDRPHGGRTLGRRGARGRRGRRPW